MANKDYVVFETADGEEVSNDPRWKAERVLAAAGVEVSTTDSADAQEKLDAANEEIAALRAALEAAQVNESLEEDESEPEDQSTYSEVKGKDLVTLAKERGIDVKGKKAGEVRAELVAQDSAAK